jgi:CMP-N-acetylneuraminic acid synthetase
MKATPAARTEFSSPAQQAVRVAALVPMRHRSERVPGKNYREVDGRPLYAYILESLLSCPEIDRIVVDTDSAPIRAGLAEAFPQVLVLDRPEHLRPGEVSMNAVIAHDIDIVPADVFLQTHSTNPLLRPRTISAAIRTFLEDADHDSLFSVTPVQVRLWSEQGAPINHDPASLLRTQDLPPVYQENSCLYLFRPGVFRERSNRIGRRPRLFVIDREESWDVDEEVDVEIVSALIRKRRSLEQESRP